MEELGECNTWCLYEIAWDGDEAAVEFQNSWSTGDVVEPTTTGSRTCKPNHDYGGLRPASF